MNSIRPRVEITDLKCRNTSWNKILFYVTINNFKKRKETNERTKN